MFISHYSKEALLSNIKATEKHLQDLKEELVYWEKKDDPNWKPEETLEVKMMNALYKFFQTEKCALINARFAHLMKHEIPGSESHDNMEDFLYEECYQLAKQIIP